MCRYTTMKKNEAPDRMHGAGSATCTAPRAPCTRTEFKAVVSPGLKCMVTKMPVTICMTNTSSASEPKKYQMLKFFGA